MDKGEIASKTFESGFNCAQSVFTTFCEDFGLDKELGLKIASSFGGGMGHLGEACGAVTGALMALGLKYGQTKQEDKESKELNYKLDKEFAARFKKLNGSINCSELLGYDLTDEKQFKEAKENGICKRMCPKFVKDAANLLEEMLKEYEVIEDEKKG